MECKKIAKNNGGYLLTEVLIALSVFVIGLTGFFVLLSKSFGLNKVISDQFIANYLAIEGIEVSKNNLDNQILSGGAWNSGFDTSACYEVDYSSDSMGSSVDCNSKNYLKYDSVNNLYNYSIGNISAFDRKIKVSPILDGGNQVGVKINSIVTWIGRGGYQGKINLESHFYKWR